MAKNIASNNNDVRIRLDKLDNYLKQTDISNLDVEVKKIINNYIRLDNAYRIKHEELKNIYEEYKKLYNKCKIDEVKNSSGGLVTEIILARKRDDKDLYMKKINDIKLEMNNNDEDMYRKRIKVLKDIKSNENIHIDDKDILANKMFVAYRKDPIIEYKPIQELEELKLTNDKQVKVSDLDNAYFQKHNELMQMYRAYKVLYDKTLKYKNNLDEYKTLDIKSSISKDDFKSMLDDQKFIMESLDDMQDNLIKKDILRNDERVPTTPVINNVRNMNLFNDSMKDQIHNIINRDQKITNEAKQQFDTILTTNNNDSRNDLYREMILLRKK